MGGASSGGWLRVCPVLSCLRDGLEGKGGNRKQSSSEMKQPCSSIGASRQEFRIDGRGGGGVRASRCDRLRQTQCEFF